MEEKLKAKSAKRKATIKNSKIEKETKEVKKTAESSLNEVKIQKAAKSSLRVKKVDVQVEKKAKTGEKNIKLKVFNKDGKEAGDIEVSAEFFAAKVNQTLMAQAVRVYLANQRAGTSKTKTRGEVVGSTRKIYRQKGTGRARHGALTAPLFVGGGITFGPQVRDLSLKMPQKMRKSALCSALTVQHKNNKVVVVEMGDNASFSKTKEMMMLMKALNLVNKKGKADKVLLVGNNGELVRSAQNIENLSLRKTDQLSTYEVLNSNHIVFLKDALSQLYTGGKA